MKKRIFSLFTSLIMVISLVAVMPMMTAGAKTSGDYEYVILDDGTVEITGYNGNGTNLTIPSTLGGKKVTRIGFRAFYECSSLTSVTIPDSVTSIGDMAFEWCESLTSITIPDSVTSIGVGEFYGFTSLTSITIPNSVTSIGGWAFSGTPWLENKQKANPLVIVNGILIDGKTCSGKVTIPNSVTSIGGGAFSWCENLTSITI